MNTYIHDDYNDDETMMMLEDSVRIEESRSRRNKKHESIDEYGWFFDKWISKRERAIEWVWVLGAEG